MARIKFGPIVSDISGSIGSATFQKNLYGNTLRNRPRNTRAGTAAQLYSRSLMMQCQYAWRALSPATRKQWDQYISFSGVSINRDRTILMTGHSLFLKYNFARLLAGMPILSTLIYISAPQWPSFSSLKIYFNNVQCYFSAWIQGLPLLPTLFLSPCKPASQSFSESGLRFMLIDFVWEDSILVGPSYLSIFGRYPAAYETLHYKLQFWSTTAPILSSIQTGTGIVYPA